MSSVLKNPEETNIFAIIYPASGKLERLKELLKDFVAAIHKNEDYTPRYFMTEQLDTNEPALHFFETYKNRDGADKHTKTEHFKGLVDAAEREGLFGKEPYIVQTKTIGGFDWDHQLI